MTRRALSRLLVTVALLVATVAWAGFTLQRTVFDSTRTERVLRVLLDDETVRRALLQQVVSKADAAMPAELRAQVSLEQLTTAGTQALDDPRVRTAIEQALVGSHQYVIGEVDQPPVLDASLLDAVIREQVNAVRPDLGELIPATQPIVIELPSTGLSAVQRVHDLTTELTPLLAMAAACAALAALVITNDRASVLRRIGFWAVSMGAVWIVLRFALPLLIEAVLGDGGAILGALSSAIAGGMGVPGTVLFVAGVALVVGSMAVGSAEHAVSSAAAGAEARRRKAAKARDRFDKQQAKQSRQAARSGRGGSTATVAGSVVAGGAAGGATGAVGHGGLDGGPVVAPAMPATQASPPVTDTFSRGEIPADPATYGPPARPAVSTMGPHPGAPSITGGVALPPAARNPAGGVPMAGGAGVTAAPLGRGPLATPGTGPGATRGPAPVARPVVTSSPAAEVPAPPVMPQPPVRGGEVHNSEADDHPTSDDAEAAGATELAPPVLPSPSATRLTVADRPVVPLSEGDASDPTISIPLPRRSREGREGRGGRAGRGDRAGAGAAPAAETAPAAERTAGPERSPVRAAPQPAERGGERPTPNEWLGGFSMNPKDHPRVADPAPAPPRWIEGVGYVYDYAPTDSARWIDGLGYVLDED
ncbi:MAG: hypothetical protein AB7O92_14400 [Acidimicrobiia bacterium]